MPRNRTTHRIVAERRLPFIQYQADSQQRIFHLRKTFCSPYLPLSADAPFLPMLKATPLALLLILLILVTQAIFFSPQTITFTHTPDKPHDSTTDETRRSFGLGSPIEIITVNGQTVRRIQWVTLALNLAITWAVATFIAVGLTKTTRLTRPTLSYGLVTITMIGNAFLASIVISKAYWGYWFKPPAFLSEVNEISKVQAIVFLKTERGTEKPVIVNDDQHPLSIHLAGAKQFSEDALSGRVLLELDRRNLIPPDHPSTLAGLPELYATIQRSGMLERSSDGYDSSAQLSGTVLDAIGKAPGERLVFLCVQGGQLSNDHYPYYELLFRGKPDSAQLTLVRGQRYYYDAAGMEGFEWYVIWPFLTIPIIVLGFVVFTIARAFRKPVVAAA
jgi:hypothetical protein